LALKVCGEFDDVTSAGKLFHVRAAATGNARSLTVVAEIIVSNYGGMARLSGPEWPWQKPGRYTNQWWSPIPVLTRLNVA